MHTKPLLTGMRRIINQKLLLRPVRNSRLVVPSSHGLFDYCCCIVPAARHEANIRDSVALAMLRCFLQCGLAGLARS